MKRNGEYIGVDEKFIPEDEKYVDESLLGDKEKTKKVVKTIGIGYVIFFVFIILVFIGIFAFSINFISKVGNSINNIGNSINNIGTNMELNDQSQMSKVEIDIFNGPFEVYSGTKVKMFVIKVLDEVINNNNKNSDKLITVIYNETNTTEPSDIFKLKQSFEDGKKYEIMLGYGENGLVNKVTILDIE